METPTAQAKLEVHMPFGTSELHLLTGAIRLVTGGETIVLEPSDWLEIKQMLVWWRRVREKYCGASDAKEPGGALEAQPEKIE
jgi:hypothetical protein